MCENVSSLEILSDPQILFEGFDVLICLPQISPPISSIGCLSQQPCAARLRAGERLTEAENMKWAARTAAGGTDAAFFARSPPRKLREQDSRRTGGFLCLSVCFFQPLSYSN